MGALMSNAVEGRMNASHLGRIAATARASVVGLTAALSAVLPLAGCTVYEPVPYQQPSSFDRAWAAAAGALQDQGVTIQSQDRSAGVIRGNRGAINVTATVRTQADGRVRVEFNTTGTAGADPTLGERISASYDARMGR
jgi:hypothetical protein